QISYSNDVNPIIMNNCAQSGCHGSINAGQFSLLGYDNLIKGGEVKTGDPKSSKLYNSITSLEEDDLMPRSPYSRLNDDKIKIIYLWILQGAKNN
ncbi:MAG: c-type cytochrome domain-containing protein, partial [Bacteroidota bacterium]